MDESERTLWAKIGSRFRSTMRVRSRISELCQCMRIINTLSKLLILISILRIGNLLISSLYGATEIFASWFEMAFNRCVLEVTFHVNGLDLTYANIWQTSFTDVDIKQWLRRFPEEWYACKYDRELACD